MKTITVAIDITILAARVFAAKFSGLELMAKNPRKIISYSGKGANTKKNLYSILGIKSGDDYPDIAVFITPAFWVYNGDADNVGTKPDIAIVPKMPLDYMPGLVNNDNIYSVDVLGSIDQEIKVIEEIMKVVKDIMDNDPEYLRSLLVLFQETSKPVANNRIEELEEKCAKQQEIIDELKKLITQ
jgi:hypothetical protein